MIGILGVLFFFIQGVTALASCGSFLRGDANMDGKVNLFDAVFILQYLFTDGQRPACLEIADANADGNINLGDAVFILQYLYSGGPAPSPILQKCSEGSVSSLCSCGGIGASTGHCCFGGQYQTKPCEYAAYAESIKKSDGRSQGRIFLCSINSPQKCGPVNKEYQLTDSSYEEANPDTAFINYLPKSSKVMYTEFGAEEIIIWQRYENEISNIYVCMLKGKEAKDCEKNKFKLAAGFNPSIEFFPDLNLRGIGDISRNMRTEDIIAVWETDKEIKGCVVEYRGNYPVPFRCNEKTIASKRSDDFAESVLEGNVLMWKSGRLNSDANINELFMCSLKSSGKELAYGQVYPLSCSTSPAKIDSGDIGPETGGFLSTGGESFIGYSKKVGQSEYNIFLNRMIIEFSNIYTLDSINLYHSPGVVGKGNEFYMVFKDINYPNQLSSAPAEHIIWIIGGESSKMAGLIQNKIIPSISSGAAASSSPYPGTQTQSSKTVSISTLVNNGLKLFRVVSENHLSTEGPNTLCNSEICYVMDKKLGAKQKKSPTDGKFDEWNNFQNEQLLCQLNGIIGLQAGGKVVCASKNDYIERIL